jgi:ABC-type multidrug transport system fused ATPase/permease subunit
VHVHTAAGELVAQLTGVHFFDLGAPSRCTWTRPQVHVFGADGACCWRPSVGRHAEGTLMARIDLDLAHSLQAEPAADADYALLPLKMTFEDGGAYALLGPSGCGKTTLLNIISGLVAPSQGTVKFDGET